LKKTNAARLLEAQKIPYNVCEYDVSDNEISGVAVARKTSKDPDQVFKTLVTEGKHTGYNVFVIPCNMELDLKKAARAARDKHIEMIKSRELEPLTGYVHGGCSPIGMKKPFPTYIDETAIMYDEIFVSGGRVGLQIGLAPSDLAAMTGAQLCDLI